MNSKNKFKHFMRIFGVLAFLSLISITMMGVASAKSLYVNKDLNANSPISAYDIQVAPNYLVLQQTSVPTRYGGVGLAIDTDSETLFVSFETFGNFDIVDAKTLAKLGQVTAPGANDLAGIVVDQHKQKLYTVDRGKSFIYIYNWDATTKTLTLDKTQTLSGTNQIYGLALDETNDVLYVGDLTASVKSFKTSDWSSAGVYSLASGLTSMGVAVDEKNGLIYTGNALDAGWLSKIDINTHAETRFNIRTLPGAISDDNVVGLAVDYDTGLLYITTGNQYGTGSDRLIVFDKNLNKLYNTGDIGNPTGLVVPRKEISYNPLNLAKIADKNCVESGDTLTYSISYQNTNPLSVDNVVITDTLSSDVTYVSNTGGGSYSSGVVTWNLGTLASGAQGSVTVTVTINSGASDPIANSAKIVSTQTGQTTQNLYTKYGNCGGQTIPEFPGLILPVVGILGMVMLLSRRKEE